MTSKARSLPDDLRGYEQVVAIADKAKSDVKAVLRAHKILPSLIKIEPRVFNALVRTSHSQLDPNVSGFAYNSLTECWEIWGVPCESSVPNSGIRFYKACCTMRV